MSFAERFRLLMESGQADERTIAASQQALRTVEEHYGIKLTEHLGAALATHLAITMKRLLNGQALCELPDVVWEELESYPEELALAASLAADLEKRLAIPISRTEVGFIAIHLGRIRIELDQARRGQGSAEASGRAPAPGQLKGEEGL